MATSRNLRLVCLLAAATGLSACVAPDEVWPDLNKPSPAQARKNTEAMGLCIRPPVEVIGIPNPTTVLIRTAPGKFSVLATRGECFEAASVKAALVPIDPARACLADEYQVRYTARDGRQVVCALAPGAFIMTDDEFATEMRERAPHATGPWPIPAFRY